MNRIRCLACVLACAAIMAVVSACRSGADPGPLAVDLQQRAAASCVPAPNPPDIPAWNTPIGFAVAMFVNVSRSPLKIESVKLIDAHNLILHGALVYQMAHSKYAMISETAWDRIADSVPPAARAGIHEVPAVIPAGFPASSFKPRPSLNLYEIVPDISEASPGGGWAIGMAVKYSANGQTHTATAYTGYAIGVPAKQSKSYCDAQLKAINAAFKASR